MPGEVGRMCPFQPEGGRLPADRRRAEDGRRTWCGHSTVSRLPSPVWGNSHANQVEVIPALQAAVADEVTLYRNPVEALVAVDMRHRNARGARAIAKEPVHRPMEGRLTHAAGDLTHVLAQV